MQTRPYIVLGALLAISTSALAQTVQPDPNLPVPNPGGVPLTEPAPPAATMAPGTAGATVAQPVMATGEFIETQQAGHTLASDLMGQSVLDSTGQQIAEISDLILDDQSRIAGVILATGGFLGIGEHNVGVELNQLTPNPDATGYVVSLSREAIEAAPGFKTMAEESAMRDTEMLRQQQQSTTPPVTPAPAQ